MVGADTKAELIDSAVNGVTALAKEFFVRRQEQQQFEREAEFKKELARIRAGDQTDSESADQSTEASAGPQQPSISDTTPAPSDAGGREGTVETLRRAAETAEEYDELLEAAADMEDCRLCTRLIKATKKRPVSEQRELVPELTEFLASVEEGTPTQEVAAQIQQSDALMELLQDEMGGVMNT
jgi:hypothetical protein